jgi:hypothetical protein
MSRLKGREVEIGWKWICMTLVPRPLVAAVASQCSLPLSDSSGPCYKATGEAKAPLQRFGPDLNRFRS